VNADSLQPFLGNLRNEFTRILYFRSGLLWEWTGNDSAPVGLLTGTANYIRLMGGWANKGWPRRGLGLRWDEGYVVTANFLRLLKNFEVQIGNLFI